jgi:acetyl-CoA carboxylase carboxyltransferase component
LVRPHPGHAITGAGLRGFAPVPALRSSFDAASDAARANREAMRERLTELEGLLDQARGGGGERYVERHRKRGKLLPRERIELMLDRDAPFLELMPFIGAGTDYHVGGSTVCGIGVVEGVECMLSASDPTVRGGTSNPATLRKALRAMQIARENRLPFVNFVESAARTSPARPSSSSPAARCSAT